MKRFMITAVCGVVALGSAQAASLSVNGAAALDGSYGLAITLGGANNVYVEEATAHNAETTYTARFKVSPGTASLTPNTSVRFGVAPGD